MGRHTWEGLASEEGQILTPEAACTFHLREAHYDAAKAVQNFIPEIANEESFFPTQMHKYLQGEIREANKLKLS